MTPQRPAPPGPDDHPIGQAPDPAREPTPPPPRLEGECTEFYGNGAAYRATPRASTGVAPHLSSGGDDRPTFAANERSAPNVFAAAGRETGEGSVSQRGLLLHFDERGTLNWGLSMSHCDSDEFESVVALDDGSLVATLSYRAGGNTQTELHKYSNSGSLVFKTHLFAEGDPSGAAVHEVHSELARDPADGSFVVVIETSSADLVLVRVDSGGVVETQRVLTAAQLGLTNVVMADLAIHGGAPATRSEILVGLFRGLELFSADFDPIWRKPTAGGAYAEVALCSTGRYVAATVGFTWEERAHVVNGYVTPGNPIFSFRVAGDAAMPEYGVLRPESYSLSCTRTGRAQLVIQKSEREREVRGRLVGLVFDVGGTMERVYDGFFPESTAFRGTAGPGIPANALLVLDGDKFRMIGATEAGWTAR